jgi:hypothetical protein
MPEDKYRAGGGRDRAKPIARNRNAGRGRHRVAQFLYPLLDWLLFGRHNNYIVARASKQ